MHYHPFKSQPNGHLTLISEVFNAIDSSVDLNNIVADYTSLIGLIVLTVILKKVMPDRFIGHYIWHMTALSIISVSIIPPEFSCFQYIVLINLGTLAFSFNSDVYEDKCFSRAILTFPALMPILYIVVQSIKSDGVDPFEFAFRPLYLINHLIS